MSKLFNVEVLICATAYIRADSAEEAAEIAMDTFNVDTDASVHFHEMFGEVPVSEAQFDSEDLPEVSLSPAMTFLGAADAIKDYKGFDADSMDEVETE